MNKQNKIAMIAALASCAAGNLMAGDFTSYANGDVLIGFRNAGSAVDLVVDAGPISTFLTYAHNTTNSITAYSASQLVGDVGTASTSWSAFTWTSDETLYLTEPRGTNALNFNVQTPVYPDSSSGIQQVTVNRMLSIVQGAEVNIGNVNYPNSTATAVEEDDDSQNDPNYPSGVSYYRGVTGQYGYSFNGTVEINPESKIPSHFTTAQRSDFYQVSPGYGSGTYLGYFELETNGSMVYVAYPLQTPVISSYKNGNGTNSITYITGTYGTYKLCATNSAGLTAPRSTWPVISTLSSGDTSAHTVTDSTSDANRFYIIQGTP